MALCVKSVRIRSFSGPYFPAFGLNTKRYSLSLHIFSPNAGKYGHFLHGDGDYDGVDVRLGSEYASALEVFYKHQIALKNKRGK